MISKNTSGRRPIVTDKTKKRRLFSISSVLAISFGSLVFVAVLAVLGISLYSGLTNTRELLLDKATFQMSAVHRNLTSVLDPMENRARFIADLIYEGKIDINDPDSMDDGLVASLAGSRYIIGAGFMTPDLNLKLADRKSRRIIETHQDKDFVSLDFMEKMRKNPVGSWGALIYSPEADATLMNYQQPVIRNGEFLGIVIVAVPVSVVSDAVKTKGLGKDEGRFILYGKDHVLSQEGFHVNSSVVTYEGVAPKLSEIEDPILSTIWSAPRQAFRLIKGGTNFEGHFTNIDGDYHQFIYSSLEGYTDKPLIIGYRLPYEDAAKQFFRLVWAGVVGLAILVISILIAYFIGRKIARPIKALAVASQEISSLEFDNVAQLPPSRLKELNEASDAYNTMLRGLNWFENYVPKSLVRKLMQSGAAQSETRSVTVMFTDIVGFTPLAEKMTSEQVADMLNHHFELLTQCIEAEGGTVDKFIGDAVMAFWGAPDYQTDHAARACRAAIAIKKAIEGDNELRLASSEQPIHVRIGIHTGRLVVGNIGSSGRLNYTVVGDTVNIAQRIEQLGKSLAKDYPDAVLALISDAVRSEANDITAFENVGEHGVKGRDGKVKIFRLT
ncbi:MAG: adenylate/guanylate cyclase domain-containing protein [Sneathiella sp.]